MEKLDTSITDITETRIFRLKHADSTELATIVTSLYTRQHHADQTSRATGDQRRAALAWQQQQAAAAEPGRRPDARCCKSKVVAVGDPRTNALVVTAARDTMMQIAETVGRLDATDAKKQRVYIYSLEHADADSVATVLRGMLGDQSANSIQQQSGAARLTNRSAQGAAMDTSQFSNSGRRRRWRQSRWPLKRSVHFSRELPPSCSLPFSSLASTSPSLVALALLALATPLHAQAVRSGGNARGTTGGTRSTDAPAAATFAQQRAAAIPQQYGARRRHHPDRPGNALAGHRHR